MPSNINITGHSDIAPHRKTDPGEKFPWKKLYKNELAIRAASEGKHVYCEKSSTTSFESAKKIFIYCHIKTEYSSINTFVAIRKICSVNGF